MPEAPPPDEGASPPPGTAEQRGLGNQATDYFRTRLELALIEAREAGHSLVWLAICLAAAVACLVLAYLFAVAAVTAAIAVTNGGGAAWGWALGGTALVHGLGALVLGLVMRRRLGAGFFTLTRQQFHEEKQWLHQTRTGSSTS